MSYPTGVLLLHVLQQLKLDLTCLRSYVVCKTNVCMSGSSSTALCARNAHITLYDVTTWSWVNLVNPEGTIGDGAGNTPNPTGCNVIETISVLKFPQVQGSLQLARKVALDQIAYENEARGLKSLKILGLCRCNEGTIDDGPVKNPNRAGSNVI